MTYFQPKSSHFFSGNVETDSPTNASMFPSKLVETIHLPNGDLKEVWENIFGEQFERIKRYDEPIKIMDCTFSKNPDGSVSVQTSDVVKEYSINDL